MSRHRVIVVSNIGRHYGGEWQDDVALAVTERKVQNALSKSASSITLALSDGKWAYFNKEHIAAIFIEGEN